MSQSSQDPWYSSDLESVPEPTQKLLEEYSKIPPELIIPHILQVRNKAFKVFPYPCIGLFRFLELHVRKLPFYNDILGRLCKGEKFLDVGCCFGQDLRQLVADGVPSENLFGTDLREKLVELGYELFRDKGISKTKFIIADIFDQNSDLKQLNGQISIVYAASFFHLFGWDRQIEAVKNLMRLMNLSPGAMIISRQVGTIGATLYEYKADQGAIRNASMYLHDVESLKKQWKQIEDETGTRWEIDAQLTEIDMSTKPQAFGWMPYKPALLTWVARQV